MVEPVFLPLTMAAAGDCTSGVRSVAEAANKAAAHCWTALVGGCDSTSRSSLILTLHDLSAATAGSAHYRRVAEAECRIDEAVREGDGAEFAEAFVGYDQAVATVLSRLRSTPA
ncbi:sugar ABC transporter substrate-binding protein [Lentzea tibetensis]|nr:sugar ABC transporter substrate-binding protein [Lentzea tibetensis]